MSASEVRANLERRVTKAADEALATQKFVAPLDVLIGIGWLAPSAVDLWRQGRVVCLADEAQVNESKLSDAMGIFRVWANELGLKPSDALYVSRTRDRRPLQFSRSGDAQIEAAYRTHWVSPDLSAAQRQQIDRRQSKPSDLVVVDAAKAWTCTECAGTGDLLIMDGPGPLCLECADLDHLVFLPSGDTALSRRAKKASGLTAVVVRYSRARGRYERQGILVEEEALAQAEEQCLDDEEARHRRRLRDETRRQAHDVEFDADFAAEIIRLFPGCPPERAVAIASHATARKSGRVGRSAAGRALDPEAVTLAVVASVRHLDTTYDALLMAGVGRPSARAQVGPQIQDILDGWRDADSGTAD